MKDIKHNWGSEVLITNNKLYSCKIFVIKEGQKTSKIFSRKQDKTISVLQGIIQLNIENINKILNEGDTYHILPKIIHQITAIRGDATILEVGTEFLEEDIVKIDI